MDELKQRVIIHKSSSARIFQRAGQLLGAIKQRVTTDEYINYDVIVQRMGDIASDIKLHLSKLVMNNTSDVATRCQIMKRYQEDSRRFEQLNNAMSVLDEANYLRAFEAPLLRSREDCEDSMTDIAGARSAGNSMGREIGSNKQLHSEWTDAKEAIADMVCNGKASICNYLCVDVSLILHYFCQRINAA